MMFSGFVGFWAMLGSACLFVGNGPRFGALTCRSAEGVARRAREAGAYTPPTRKKMSASTAAPANFPGLFIPPSSCRVGDVMWLPINASNEAQS